MSFSKEAQAKLFVANCLSGATFTPFCDYLLAFGTRLGSRLTCSFLIFDKKPSNHGRAATRDLWIYDLRSNQKFSVKQKQIASEDMVEFVQCYCPSDRARRRESKNFRRVKYADIVARDKASLDIHWRHKDHSKPHQETPEALLAEILLDLDEARREFAAAEELVRRK